MIYGKDAFDGLRILEYLMSDEIGVFNEQIDERLEKRVAVEQELAASEWLGCSRCSHDVSDRIWKSDPGFGTSACFL